jgi:hypothetical protein
MGYKGLIWECWFQAKGEAMITDDNKTKALNKNY